MASFKDLPIPKRGLWNEDNFSPTHKAVPETDFGSMSQIGGSLFQNHMSTLSDRYGVHTAVSSNQRRPFDRSSLFTASKIVPKQKSRAVTNYATTRDNRKNYLQSQ